MKVLLNFALAAVLLAAKPGPLVAPERYALLFPRATWPVGPRYANLLYEGNNLDARGGKDQDGLYSATGAQIAEGWRAQAGAVKKIFVLRDAIFSQQDHPYDSEPVAPMMPPSWITAALGELDAGRPIRAPRTYEPAEDGSWEKIPDAEALFGSFPPSVRLAELCLSKRAAATAADKRRILNARAFLRALAADAEAMAAVAAKGREAVAAAGAERITESDRRYFGEALRREKVIPIDVENANEHETVDEGKGFRVPGRQISEASIALARDALLSRRLRDGDLALERYDLASPADRKRAIAVLEAILPKGKTPPGGDVWLWVNGKLKPMGIRGEDATAYIEAFRAMVAKANIETARLRYISKPSVKLPTGDKRGPAFEAAVDRFRALDLPLSVNLDTAALQALLPAGAGQ